MLHISPSLVAQFEAGGTLNTAQIGYHTVLRNSDITASSETVGFPASSVLNPLTYERWLPLNAPATLTIDSRQLTIIDYIGIAAHTLGTTGAVVTIEYSDDGVTWIEVYSDLIINDNAIMVLFEPIMVRFWRITSTTVAEIGVVYAGRSLQMERGVYGGHSPGTLSRQTDIEPSRSVGGQFLGRTVVRQGFATTYDWRFLTPRWYRQNFDPFVEAAVRYPFFIAWQPERYPNDVLYAWTVRGDIEPRYMSGNKKLMQVSVDVEGVK